MRTEGPIVEPFPPAAFPPVLVDMIERVVTRLKGQTLPIRSPHDFADAIQRMDARIPKTAPPAAPAPSKSERPAKEAPASIRPPAAAEPTGDEDPVEVLMRVRDRVMEHGQRIPNHTCVETIQRDTYESTAGRAGKSCDAVLAFRKQRDFFQRLTLASTDWLRLDVAYSSGGEIFSWAGANKFEEGDLDEWIPEGAIGTGPFTTMILSAFERRGPKYIFEGETTLDGRRLFEYGFTVAREDSHYRFKAHKEWIITGYTGSLLVDPKTADLVRLTVRTEELPPETSTCEADTALDYWAVQLSGAEYLLPKAARQRFIGRDGGEAENTMSFSACRDFQAQSKVAFGDGAATGRPKGGSATGELDLPPGLAVSVELTTTVRIGEVAAGDRIEGRLAAPIQDEKKHTLAAAGTLVQGRLMRVETEYAPHRSHTVALRWETIQAGDRMSPLFLLPNRRPANPRTGTGGALRRRGMEIELPVPSEARYGVFHIAPDRKTLESGFRSEWFTAKP